MERSKEFIQDIAKIVVELDPTIEVHCVDSWETIWSALQQHLTARLNRDHKRKRTSADIGYSNANDKDYSREYYERNESINDSEKTDKMSEENIDDLVSCV